MKSKSAGFYLRLHQRISYTFRELLQNVYLFADDYMSVSRLGEDFRCCSDTIALMLGSTDGCE